MNIKMNKRLVKYYIDEFLGFIGLRAFIKAVRVFKKIEIDDGHFLSTFRHRSIDNTGQPIPWITYPAIDYLNQLDFSNKRIFEYGGGNSSFYWAARSKHVTVVESDKEWSRFLNKNKAKNMSVDFEKTKKEYVKKINSYKTGFDVIVIDGVHRKDCVKYALKNLNKGGFIILDNSEREIEATVLLSKTKLIRVDFLGYAPINPYKSQTSFFIDRKYSIKHK